MLAIDNWKVKFKKFHVPTRGKRWKRLERPPQHAWVTEMRMRTADHTAAFAGRESATRCDIG